jgi:glutamate synthase (NADPH/NADH) small chain
MSDPRGFLKFERHTPERRPTTDRVRDWKEMYLPMPEAELRSQAARCMDCGVPFCQSGPSARPEQGTGSGPGKVAEKVLEKAIGCPVENLIPDWNDLVHRDLWQDALTALHATNNFPEFTGKLCPAPCESACVLGLKSDPVTIRNIESSIIDRGFAQGWVKPVKPSASSGRKVAVVGSGPAGLAAAQQLARAGHSVTVFEKAPRAGGLLRYGIPEFKMEKSVLDRRLAQLEAEGVRFETGVAIGPTPRAETKTGSNYSLSGATRAIEAEKLVRDFDAVCLTLGAEQPRDLAVPGRELKGIHQAMEYLTRENLLLEGATASSLVYPGDDTWDARGKNVIILGGGDTGSDCLGTAHRQGAISIAQFELLPEPPRERAPSTPWPMWPMQLRSSHAHEEGGKRLWSVSTTGFVGDDQGRVRALRAQQVTMVQGRPTPVPGTEFEMPADLVILAMGFTGPARAGLHEALGLRLDPRGNIQTGADLMSSRPGVFAAGDVRRGASLIVWAIAEGRRMAASVDRYLGSARSSQTWVRGCE